MVSFVILCILFYAIKNIILRRGPYTPLVSKGYMDFSKLPKGSMAQKGIRTPAIGNDTILNLGRWSLIGGFISL